MRENIICFIFLLFYFIDFKHLDSLWKLGELYLLLLFVIIRSTPKNNYTALLICCACAASWLAGWGYLQYMERLPSNSSYFVITGPYHNPAIWAVMVALLLGIIINAIIIFYTTIKRKPWFLSSLCVVVLFCIPILILSSARAAYTTLMTSVAYGLYFKFFIRKPRVKQLFDPKPEENKEQDPCSTAESLSSNTDFRNKVDDYFDKNLTSKLEDGWMKTKSGEYIYPDIQTDKSMNYSAKLTTGKIFVEQYHCHPVGQSCIPSPDDLQKMAFYYQTGRIDVPNYSYGVISDTGCISIIITSEEEYAIFAQAMYNKNEEKKTEQWLMDIWKECVTDIILGKCR